MKRFFPGILLGLLLTGFLHGAAIGETAPELDLGPWMQGEKFRLAERGYAYKIFAVDFFRIILIHI